MSGLLLLGAGGGGSAAATPIGTPTTSGTRGPVSLDGNFDVTLTTGIANGELGVIEFNSTGSIVPTSITDNTGATWTMFTVAESSHTIAMAYRRVSGATVTTVTVNCPAGASAKRAIVRAVTNSAASPFDNATAKESGTSASATLNGTASKANSVSFASTVFIGAGADTINTPAAGWSNSESNSTTVFKVLHSYRNNTASGAFAKTDVNSNSRTWFGMTLTLNGD